MAITTFDEPIVTNDFVARVIAQIPDRCVGLAIMPSGGLPTVVRSPRKQGKASWHDHVRAWGARAGNILAISLIYGPPAMLVQGLRVAAFKARTLGHEWFGLRSPSIAETARRYAIPVRRFPEVNHPDTLAWLASLDVDVIINQAPGILRNEFLSIPRLGVLNRHNALLPRNRGLFSTFWAVYRQEPCTGVSIHFVVRELDAGPIVAQHEIAISPGDTVQAIARRCYALAPTVMAAALQQLEDGTASLRDNDNERATYNSYPTLAEAWDYRRQRILRFIGRDR